MREEVDGPKGAIEGSDPIRLAIANRRPISDVLIIDAHVHLGPYDRFRIPYNDAHGMIVSMDRIGIDKACIFSIVACDADYRRGNDMVAEAVGLYPDRFLGFATIDPNDPERVVEELERCARAFPLYGIKFHPGLHAYPAEGPHYRSAIEYANERGLVLLSHSWSSPRVLASLAECYPRAKFIQAHVAAAWDPRVDSEWFHVARDQPNVWLDLCSSVAYFGALEAAVDRYGSEKLLFASDFPFMDAAYQLGRVVYANIPFEDKVKILGETMKGVLGLEDGYVG